MPAGREYDMNMSVTIHELCPESWAVATADFECGDQIRYEIGRRALEEGVINGFHIVDLSGGGTGEVKLLANSELVTMRTRIPCTEGRKVVDIDRLEEIFREGTEFLEMEVTRLLEIYGSSAKVVMLVHEVVHDNTIREQREGR